MGFHIRSRILNLSTTLFFKITNIDEKWRHFLKLPIFEPNFIFQERKLVGENMNENIAQNGKSNFLGWNVLQISQKWPIASCVEISWNLGTTDWLSMNKRLSIKLGNVVNRFLRVNCRQPRLFCRPEVVDTERFGKRTFPGFEELREIMPRKMHIVPFAMKSYCPSITVC